MEEQWNNILWEIVTIITTSLGTLILSLLTPLKIKVRFIKMISSFSWMTKESTPKVSGVWRADYTNENFPGKYGSHNVKLYQVGEKIVGESIVNQRKILIDGKLVCDNYFYGSFLDCKACGKYYGTFQVKIYHQINEMRGKWVGYNYIGSDSISHGEWNWVLIKDIEPNN